MNHKAMYMLYITNRRMGRWGRGQGAATPQKNLKVEKSGKFLSNSIEIFVGIKSGKVISQAICTLKLTEIICLPLPKEKILGPLA